MHLVVAHAVMLPRDLLHLTLIDAASRESVNLRLESMTRSYASLTHRGWPTEIVGPCPDDGRRTPVADVRVYGLTFDECKRARRAFSHYPTAELETLAVLKHGPDKCVKDEARRAVLAERDRARLADGQPVDKMWAKASHLHPKLGADMVVKAEGIRNYLSLSEKDQYFIHLGFRHHMINLPDASEQDRMIIERKERSKWFLGLGNSIFFDWKTHVLEDCDRNGVEEAVSREHALEAALTARGVDLRMNSFLARRYVFEGVGDIDEIALVLEEMQWLYDCTRYVRIVRENGRRRSLAELEAIKDDIARNHVGPMPENARRRLYGARTATERS